MGHFASGNQVSGNSIKMVSGTLFTYPGNFRAEKIMSVAKMSDSNVKVDDKFVFGETNKSQPLRALTEHVFSKATPSRGTWPTPSSAEGLSHTLRLPSHNGWHLHRMRFSRPPAHGCSPPWVSWPSTRTPLRGLRRT